MILLLLTTLGIEIDMYKVIIDLDMDIASTTQEKWLRHGLKRR